MSINSAASVNQKINKSKIITNPPSVNSECLKPQNGSKNTSELHRACSIPAIIVGEIPKLIVTASTDNSKRSHNTGAVLVVMDEPL